MTYKNLPDKNDAFNDLDQTSGKAKRNSGLTPEACQTIFEFMAKAKAQELDRRRLIQKTIEKFEHQFAQGKLPKH
jgi:hypothetical protein